MSNIQRHQLYLNRVENSLSHTHMHCILVCSAAAFVSMDSLNLVVLMPYATMRISSQ